ncbi:MAG: hypothetical protein ABUL71_00325 [Gemmatimonadota bacterium]
MNRLAVLWQAQPTSSCFAALAEALRKRGALEQATAVAAAGGASRPDYLPGRVVMARIYGDQGQWQAADAELHAAIALDPTHPLVLESLDQVAGQLAPALPVEEAQMSSEPLPAEPDPVPASDDAVGETMAVGAPHAGDDEVDEELPEPPEPVLTESLAMLYRGQGHLADAVDVLDALVARTPDDADLVARRDAVRAELAVARPLPYDAAQSGGRPVRDWLSALAASRTEPAPPASSFDAFFEAPPAPRTDASDLDAFQAWLRELDR